MRRGDTVRTELVAEFHPGRPMAPGRDTREIGTQHSSGLLKEQRAPGATGTGGVHAPFASAFVVHAQKTPISEGQLDEAYLSHGYNLGCSGFYPQR